MNVKQTTTDIIKAILSEHPNWNATEVYDEYKNRVPEKEQRKINAIQKQVQKLRPPAALPWNAGDRTRNMEVSPEGVAAIFECQRAIKKTVGQPVEIPHLVAYWIDRLRVAIPNDPVTLFLVAWAYADYTLFKRMGTGRTELHEVNTHELDVYLIDKKYDALIGLTSSIHIHMEQEGFAAVKKAFPKLMEFFHATIKNVYKEGEE